METIEEESSLKSYLRLFAIWYGVFAVTAGFAAHFVGFMESFQWLAGFAAAALVSGDFLKKEKRAPSNEERNKLVNGSFAIWLAITLPIFVLSGMMSAPNIFSIQGDPMWLGILLLMLGVSVGFVYFFFYIVYGWMARKQAAKLNFD